MPKLIKTAAVCTLLGLAGCAGIMRTQPAIGDPADTVEAKFGRPTAVYPDGERRVLEYASGPMGQDTWLATMGADGRLTAFEQVLTNEKFASLKIGKTGKDEVLRTVGRPAERSYLALSALEVWSYRYKESGVWNSMMHLHFDHNGVLRMMQNGPDPMYEERRLFMNEH